MTTGFPSQKYKECQKLFHACRYDICMTHLLKLELFVDHPYRLVRGCSAEVTMLPGSSDQTITISTAESTIRNTKMVKITAGFIFSLQFFIFHMKFRVFETGHRMIVKHCSNVISIFVMKYAKLQCTVAPWKTEKICNASTISRWRHWSDTITVAKSCASVYTQFAIVNYKILWHIEMMVKVPDT